jgi:hypothetical protein
MQILRPPNHFRFVMTDQPPAQISLDLLPVSAAEFRRLL